MQPLSFISRCAPTSFRQSAWRPRAWGRSGSTPSPARRTPTPSPVMTTPHPTPTASSCSPWSWRWAAPTWAASIWHNSSPSCRTCFLSCTLRLRGYRDRWAWRGTHSRISKSLLSDCSDKCRNSSVLLFGNVYLSWLMKWSASCVTLDMCLLETRLAQCVCCEQIKRVDSWPTFILTCFSIS